MNSTKSILFITSEFPPQPGGIGNHALNLSKQLALNGYQVHVLCDTRSKDAKLEKLFDAELDFKVTRIHRKRLLLITYLNRLITASRLLKQVDIVIASGKFSLWNAGFLSLFSAKRFIAVIHGSEVQLSNPLLQKLIYFCVRQFDCLIAVSNYTKSLLDEAHLKKTHVIPNGFEISKHGAVDESKLENVALITIGNVTQRKGQHNVISALPLLLQNFPNLHYHVVGLPTERSKLEKLATALEVSHAVTFHGSISEDEKVSLLQMATIFVMLSEKTSKGDVEGFGIAILEANSLGIPAIGALGCGIEDAIKDRYSGILIAHDDADALVEATQGIVSDYEKYSANAKAWAIQFEWSSIIKRYMILLDQGS